MGQRVSSSRRGLPRNLELTRKEAAVTEPFGLNAGIISEPDLRGRIVLWVPTAPQSGLSHWERISTFPNQAVVEESGFCSVAVMLVPLRQVRTSWMNRLFRRGEQASDSWVTPAGDTVERAGDKRTDLLLVWNAAGIGELSDGDVRRLRPAADEYRRLGRNLFLVSTGKNHLSPSQANRARYDEKRQDAGEDYLVELQRNLGQQAENAVLAARKKRDPSAEAIALTDQGVVFMVHGQSDQALAVLEEALAIYRHQGDEAGEQDVLTNLVRPYLTKGRVQDAWEALKWVHTRAVRLEDLAAQQTVLVQMAMTAMGQAMLPQAVAYLEQASHIAQLRGDGRSDSLIAWQAAICHEQLGRTDLSRAAAERAIQLARQFELPMADRYAESLARFLHGDAPLGAATDEQNSDPTRANWLLDEPVHMVLADASRGKSPRPASVLQMAFTATRSMAKFAAAGFKSVHRDQRDARLDICHSCEHYTGIRCKICGCFIAAKTWLRHEACPLDKW